MKKLLLKTVMLFALTNVAHATATIQNAKDFVNQQVSDTIDLMNKSFTKLNLTDCSAINTTRADDNVTLTNQTIWNGGVQVTGQTITFRFDYSKAPTKAGLTKRIDIYENGSATLGAEVEFTCDMLHGFTLQTGKNLVDAAGKVPGQGGYNAGTAGVNNATADLLEVYWDNSNGNLVNFMLVGPTDGGLYAQRDTAGGKANLVSATVMPSVSQALLNIFSLDKTLFGGTYWPSTWINDGSTITFVP